MTSIPFFIVLKCQNKATLNYFTLFTTATKAALLFKAKSAKTLRLRSILAVFNLCIKTE